MEQRIIDLIRFLSVEQIQKANSGHPGLPLGAAPMAYTLWAKHMKHNPANPHWQNRDRFILSAGHGSAMLYSMLHLFGYGLEMEDLQNFRQMGSKTPGHPELGHTTGVEISTGPLGQGIANGAGFAIAEAHLASIFNKPGYDIVDHHSFVLTGDGCLMEGISYEAASLAGSLKLGKLIVLYDSNDITIEGNTNITFNEDMKARFESMGWQYLYVEDGNNIAEMSAAIENAKAEKSKPTMIEIKTKIGYGCARVEGTAAAHGAPLGEDGIAEVYKFFNAEGREAFTVPEDAAKFMEEIKADLAQPEKAWHELFKSYQEEYPDLAKKYRAYFAKQIPEIIESPEMWAFEESSASRASSGKILNFLADNIPNLIGGSADLAPSNNTNLKDKGQMSADDYSGRNIHFGIREHAMGAIVNSMAAHGGIRPFAATFFVFSDYLKPAIRLAALMEIPSLFIFTHDSVGVGEDGPTHQPIDQLAMLRSIPNLNVFRPADSREVSAAYYTAMSSTNKPTAIILSRQNLPLLENSSREALKGAYIVHASDKPKVNIIATGSEVALAIDAAKILDERGISAKVVSMPSVNIFEEQGSEYMAKILQKAVPAVSIEAASTLGWHKYADLAIGIDSFGMSARGDEVFDHFGFTAEKIADRITEFLD